MMHQAPFGRVLLYPEFRIAENCQKSCRKWLTPESKSVYRKRINNWNQHQLWSTSPEATLGKIAELLDGARADFVFLFQLQSAEFQLQTSEPDSYDVLSISNEEYKIYYVTITWIDQAVSFGWHKKTFENGKVLPDVHDGSTLVLSSSWRHIFNFGTRRGPGLPSLELSLETARAWLAFDSDGEDDGAGSFPALMCNERPV